MSIYDRRYNDDGRNIVNGCLSSTNSGNMESDSQDSSSTYYNTQSSGLSATGLGSGNYINNSSPLATLCNIGNSCYLNSVVYTLRFAPRFLHNLHHLVVDFNYVQSIMQNRTKASSLGRDVGTGHLENARSWSNKDLASMEQYNSSGAVASNRQYMQKTSQHVLTEKLHDLFQNLHRIEMNESTEPFHADTLLRAIQDVSPIFEGNQQQDAHEFLMCLLNSIRDTCQTFLKLILDCPDAILNGSLNATDETEGTHVAEKESTSAIGSASSSNNATTSSLSASNLTKASFFSRKSRRKEEAKHLKNSRLQSPLKDGGSGSTQHQPTSNSLFYLNTVDLSSSSVQSTSNPNAPNTTASNQSLSQLSKNDEEISSASLLKDKERLQERIHELGLDFFSEDFEGITVSTTKCLSCETITEKKESMIDIAVPVPDKDKGHEILDCPEKMKNYVQSTCVTREFFRGENKYRCEQCTGYTEAIRSISYEVLPRLLILQLSRFSGGMEKLNSYVPTRFTLPCFCAKCCAMGDGDKLHVYKLYSVITHVGVTMSVGHYIAYTSALDYTGEYVNCPKDRRWIHQQKQQEKGVTVNGLQSNGSVVGERSHGVSQSITASSAASALASSGTSLMKKMKFGRSKASSSGDMSKNVKNMNGLTSKAITNGLGKLSMNTTCHSLDCCSIRVVAAQHQRNSQQCHQNAGNNDLSDDSGLPNGNVNYNYVPSGYGSTGRGSSKTSYNNVPLSNIEPTWYMCDDDKVKTLTQREFEDVLVPGRKNTVTPYLLFYARLDVKPTQSKQSAGTPTSSRISWSNENLQKM